MLRSPRIPNPMTWEFFVQEFRAKYITEMYRESKWKQFLNLKQRNLSVAEYEKKFSHLNKYASKLVLIEAFQCRQFEDGLHDSIKRYLEPMTSLQQVNLYQLVHVTPRFPARPDWRIRTGFRDVIPYTGTLYLIFFLKQNLYLWAWTTSYNRIEISYQKNYHLSGVHQNLYTFTESHLHIQI